MQDAIEAFEELMTGKVSIMQEMVASINAPDGSTKLVDILYRFGHRLREFHNTAETHFARHFHEKLPTLKMKEVMQRHEAKVTEFITTLIRLKYDSPHADDEEICRAVGLFETLTCAIPRTIQRGE